MSIAGALDAEIIAGEAVKPTKTIGGMLFPVGPTDSIVMDEMGVDDVAIQPVEMFRLERMSRSSFWACTYAPDGSGRHVFWFYARKGKLMVEHRWEAFA